MQRWKRFRILGTSVAEPGCLFRIRAKEFKYFNPKKWLLSSQKNNLEMFIPNPDPDFLPIPDPGVKKAPDPGSPTLPVIAYRYTAYSDIHI
jgi:hypothetical protein